MSTEPSLNKNSVSSADKMPEHWNWLSKYDAFVFGDRGTRLHHETEKGERDAKGD